MKSRLISKWIEILVESTGALKNINGYIDALVNISRYIDALVNISSYIDALVDINSYIDVLVNIKGYMGYIITVVLMTPSCTFPTDTGVLAST